MTVGELSRRTGTPVKALREYEDMGLVYTVGRSPAGYRPFDESALWCVAVIRTLRSLGLTIAEIREIAGIYLTQADKHIGVRVAERLHSARACIDTRIAALEELRRRIDEFETAHQAELAGWGGADFCAQDPRSRSKLDAPPGGRL